MTVMNVAIIFWVGCLSTRSICLLKPDQNIFLVDSDSLHLIGTSRMLISSPSIANRGMSVACNQK